MTRRKLLVNLIFTVIYIICCFFALKPKIELMPDDIIISFGKPSDVVILWEDIGK